MNTSTFFLLAAVAALIIWGIVKLLGGSADVSDDPCIRQAVDFFRAVKGIPEKSQYTQCWADIYPKGEIVCRFFENDRTSPCIYAEQIEVYGRDDEVHNRLVSEGINGSALPKGTGVAWHERFEGYQLVLTLTPVYPKSIKSYSSAIAKACREAGITVGAVEDSRVRITLQ
ncbi:MAG: hypothetical protein IJD13_02200 [Oscillospiraceae bacterium]|nr:hypothetical protein [Oscillospiraceae bacterium]